MFKALKFPIQLCVFTTSKWAAILSLSTQILPCFHMSTLHLHAHHRYYMKGSNFQHVRRLLVKSFMTFSKQKSKLYISEDGASSTRGRVTEAVLNSITFPPLRHSCIQAFNSHVLIRLILSCWEGARPHIVSLWDRRGQALFKLDLKGCGQPTTNHQRALSVCKRQWERRLGSEGYAEDGRILILFFHFIL